VLKLSIRHVFQRYIKYIFKSLLNLIKKYIWLGVISILIMIFALNICTICRTFFISKVHSKSLLCVNNLLFALLAVFVSMSTIVCWISELAHRVFVLTS